MREGISDSSEQKSGNVNDNDCFGGAGDDVLCCLGGDHGCLYFEESGTLNNSRTPETPHQSCDFALHQLAKFDSSMIIADT